MPKLVTQYQQVVQRGGEGDFTACQWQDLVGLFTTAADIKGVRSPVFASKLCHLLLPSHFPIIDRAVVGVPDDGYQGYWSRCREAWVRAECGDQLNARLQEQIGHNVTPSYPWATKITELCLTGARASHSGTAGA